jgi:pyrimidine deaminase RibD-like protein
MHEPIFRAENRAAWDGYENMPPEEKLKARDRALLWRATTLAIESAFRFGKDFPVGAVAAKGNEIIGRHFASDKRHGFRELHAERMAVLDAIADSILGEEPDTVIVTLEPCNMCQDFLATIPGVKRVGFGTWRSEVAERELVKPRDENIMSRALRVGLPFEVVHIDDKQLQTAGAVILDNMHRDPQTEEVVVDQESLSRHLRQLNTA